MNKFIALALLLSLTRALAAADGSGAHGADIEADQNNPWFLGEEPIPYCITIETDTGLDRNEIRALVAESFEDWARFFDRHGYAKMKFDETNPLLKNGAKFWDDVSRGLTLSKEELPACTNPKRQLEIRFSKSAEKNWSVDSNHSFGAALRGSYDHQEYRTGGLIWISTELKDPLERKHILLHELGHIFGMPHNSTYVMYEKVGRLIGQLRMAAAGTVVKEQTLGLIESSAWRYLIWPKDEMVFDSTELSSWATGSYSSLPPLLGAPPQTPLFVSVRDSSWMRFEGRTPSGDFKFTLHIRGFQRERSLIGTFRRRFHQFEVGPSVHTLWKNKGVLSPGRMYLEYLRAAGGMESGGGSKQVPLEGGFSDAQRMYPAIIEFPFGAVVKLFDTKTGGWFTLSSYPFEVSP